MGSQRTSCKEKKHLKNVLVGKKKPLCQFERQKRRVNLTYQLWKSLGVCKLWDNVTLSSQTFFPIYFSVCVSSQCLGILLLYGTDMRRFRKMSLLYFSKSCSFFFFEWDCYVLLIPVSLWQGSLLMFIIKRCSVLLSYGFRICYYNVAESRNGTKQRPVLFGIFGIVFHCFKSSSFVASIQASLRSKIEELILYRENNKWANYHLGKTGKNS